MSNSSSVSGAKSLSLGILENRQWWVAIGAILVASLLLTLGRGSMLSEGQSTQYVITVVPADVRGLACAMGTVMGNRRCGFDEKSQPIGGERPLRPFVTTARELLLLSGVFESNSVAAWLAEAQQSGNESRVSLECYARILGTAPRVSVRWSPDGPFQVETSVMSADVEDCVVKH